MALDSIVEGRTKLVVQVMGGGSGPGTKARIFYNPAMRSNRDITVLFGMAAAKDGWSVLDALGGTGAKGIRLANESGIDLHVQVNDLSKDAFGVIKRNIKANGLKNVTASNLEYNELLSDSGFDWIDIDPFGSPVKFIDLAVRRASRNGIISITATDTAPLCGSKKDTCQRRYMATSIRNGACHEFGLRILVGNAVRRAAVYDYGLEPVLAYYHGHYFRAYLRKGKGAADANRALENIGYVTWDDNIGYGIVSTEPASGTFAGPLWTGQLSNQALVKKMLAKCVDNISMESRNILENLKSELPIPPYHYHMDDMASLTETRPLKTDYIIEQLRGQGFGASGVHYNRKGFKTDAGFAAIREIFNTASR